MVSWCAVARQAASAGGVDALRAVDQRRHICHTATGRADVGRQHAERRRSEMALDAAVSVRAGRRARRHLRRTQPAVVRVGAEVRRASSSIANWPAGLARVCRPGVSEIARGTIGSSAPFDRRVGAELAGVNGGFVVHIVARRARVGLAGPTDGFVAGGQAAGQDRPSVEPAVVCACTGVVGVEGCEDDRRARFAGHALIRLARLVAILAGNAVDAIG